MGQAGQFAGQMAGTVGAVKDTMQRGEGEKGRQAAIEDAAWGNSYDKSKLNHQMQQRPNTSPGINVPTDFDYMGYAQYGGPEAEARMGAQQLPRAIGMAIATGNLEQVKAVFRATYGHLDYSSPEWKQVMSSMPQSMLYKNQRG
jgi:hypothetical protein